MGLLGCETTVKSINRDPSPHLEATKAAKGVRGPVDKSDRMTQSAVNNNNACCSDGLVASALFFTYVERG
jgi:hypothetical protein